MLACWLCLIVLVAAWFVAHVRAAGTMGATAAVPDNLRARWLGAAAVLVASFPLLRLAPGFEARPQSYWGDLASHARVAAEIARTGLPRGWIDSYTGGFPFGHHYPPLGWLLLAPGIRLGLPPGLAVTALGFLAALGFVLALYFGLSRCGIRAEYACLGAALLCWVAPYNAFVGGYEVFFSMGLVSQVVVMPLATWLVVATLRGWRRWEAPLFAWLSMAAHPQVTVATIGVLCLAVLVSGDRAAMARGAWTGTYAGLAGVALYGQGIASLRVPFGWPPDLGWRQLGFRPERLGAWLFDGDLLDFGRPSVMTGLLVAACMVLAMGARRPANRALLAGLAASLMLAVSGYWLKSLGRGGEFLLSFLQPLRAVSLVPPLAAAAVAVGLERGGATLAAAVSASGRARLGRVLPSGVAGLGLAIAAIGLPQRLTYTSAVLDAQRDPMRCDGKPTGVEGYDREQVRAWLGSLSMGRLWYDAYKMTKLETCLGLGGVDLASAVPTGVAAAVGAHVGILARASQFLDPQRPGSSSRAEALGIGYLLTGRGNEPPPAGWAVRHRSGTVQLLERPTQWVGVGCIQRRWRGSHDRVRARLNVDLANPAAADTLLDPHRFVAIEYTAGDVVEAAWPEPGCDDTGALVLGASARAGAVSAEVQSAAPVDVVFRFSAFPTWRVKVDGLPAAAPTLIAPGFFSVRVPPGTHRLTAEVSSLPYYRSLLALAALVTAVLAALRGRFGVSVTWFERTLLRR